MSSIGSSSASRAELNVQIGKTSVEQLQAFHDEAVSKGGGEVRARQNKDGSYTLYNHPHNKTSLGSFFRPEHSANVRAEKRDLAKTLIADIVSRRLPRNSATTGDVMSKLGFNKSTPPPNNQNPKLGNLLSSIRDEEQIYLKRDFAESGALNRTLGSPELRRAFEQYLRQEFSSENLEFVDLCTAFKSETNLLDQINMAEDLIAWMSPQGQDINISHAERVRIRTNLDTLKDSFSTNGSLNKNEQAQLQALFNRAETSVTGMLTPIIARFVENPIFEPALAANNARQKASMSSSLSSEASMLRPGSGEKFNEERALFVAQNPGHPDPDRAVAELMLAKELEIGRDTPSHSTGWDKFEGVKLESSGGATGSGRAKIGNLLFQVKSPAQGGRFMKAGFSNAENYGEFIASNIAKALMGQNHQDKVPTVDLRLNTATKDVNVTSQYLKGGTGDLKAKYESESGGKLPRGQKHPKIDLRPTDQPGQSGNGTLQLDPKGSQDIRRNLALSALLGDHDVNPGNMIALSDGGVGRIDFGHAFNDLTQGLGRSLFGGGVEFKSNRILDFFNREKISGNPFNSNTQLPKLWRDYIGASPSFEMSVALLEIANSNDQIEGLELAKSQMTHLITDLQNDPSPEAQKVLNDIVKSLKVISSKIGEKITSTDPLEVLNDTFSNLNDFVVDGQKQMKDVASLSDVQCNILAGVDRAKAQNNLNDPDVFQAVHDELVTQFAPLYDDLTNPDKLSSVAKPDGSAVQWLKMNRQTPSFTGNLSEFVTAMLKN